MWVEEGRRNRKLGNILNFTLQKILSELKNNWRLRETRHMVGTGGSRVSDRILV
jgi:hypothetical protein